MGDRIGHAWARARCNACGKPLLRANARVVDGCPCNSDIGVNDPAIDAVVDATGVDLTGDERAALGMILDRIRAGELGPNVDANHDRMRDYREAAWAALKTDLVSSVGEESKK